jgi:nitroreductase
MIAAHIFQQPVFMNAILRFLQQRNSAPKLTEPAPSAAQMEEIFRAAMRAPDHAWLRPWRFITIAGERRQAFGALLESSLLLRTPDADDAARAKMRNAPLRAPLLVVVVAKLSQHPKVPLDEQRFSAACAAHATLLAVEACGFAGIWRTGAPASDRAVMSALGLAENEEIIGFVYIGSRDGAAKPIPQLATADFVSGW